MGLAVGAITAAVVAGGYPRVAQARAANAGYPGDRRLAAQAADLRPVVTYGTAPSVNEEDALSELRGRQLDLPVAGVERRDFLDSFFDKRGSTRTHDAIDIMAPRHTAVVAVEGGTIARLFESRAGGTTVYQFDPTTRYVYYYAHLERYADGLQERQRVERGQVLGYVGTSGNAPKDTPHLHFAIFRLTDQKRWWQGTAIDPYRVLQ